MDGVGNRVVVAGGETAGAYTMDATLPEAGDRQLNQYTTTPFDTRANDRNGNVATNGAGLPTRRIIVYDYQNRPVAQTNSASATASLYAYDALGRRTQKTFIQGTVQTTLFLYRNWQEIEEQDISGVTQATYVFGRFVDEVLLMRKGGADYSCHSDQLFTITSLSDSSGTVVERFECDDFGHPTFLTPTGLVLAGSSVGNALLFTGRRYDPDSSLYYYRTRYLDPLAGRFTTRDTIGLWKDRHNFGNSFTFVANNPLRFLDPYGLDSSGCDDKNNSNNNDKDNDNNKHKGDNDSKNEPNLADSETGALTDALGDVVLDNPVPVVGITEAAGTLGAVGPSILYKNQDDYEQYKDMGYSDKDNPAYKLPRAKRPE